MSWLFSQALVEEYSEGSDLDGEQSVPSSGNHTQQVYCAPDKMTELSKKRSLSGMTFKPLTEDRGEELLTSFLAAFPVRTSPAPEREQASQENDLPCGHTWRELCLRCDPDTSLLKTVRCLWEEDLEPSSVTLPRWGMMQNGELWERTTLPRLISVTESGSWENWRTPKATEYMPPLTSEMIAKICPEKMAKRGKHSLATQVENKSMWPTPTANEDAAGTPDGKMQWMLTQAAKTGCVTRKEYQQWQTPTAMEGADCGSKWEALAKLDKGGRIQRQMVTRQTPETKTTDRAQLSPDWVEWLMGWPIGWTRLEPIELDERGWETDPADELSSQTWATPKASIDGTSKRTLEMVANGEAEKSLMRQVLMEGSNTGNIPRVATGIKARADRLKAIGNGQVPQAAELAWRILTQ